MNKEFLEDTAKAQKHRLLAMFLSWRGIFILFIVIGLGLLGYADVSGRLATEIPVKVLPVVKTNTTAALPTRIQIPAIGVDAPIVKLGLNVDHTLQVPSNETDVGWYVGSPDPGLIGPAILVGHLDTATGPAVFENLNQLKAGDKITVTLADNTVVNFTVSNSQTYPQNSFPTNQVYGDINYAGLRLITCAGVYSRLVGHYSDNLVVYAARSGQ